MAIIPISKFLDDIRRRPFDIISEYINSRLPIIAKCHADGHVWTTTYHQIKQGAGCPKCADKLNGERKRKKNKIIFRNDTIMILDVSTPSNPSRTTIIDTADYHILLEFGRITLGPHGYCHFMKSGKKHLVHRVLMKAQNTQTEVDHINRNKTDNRRCNMRLCTRSENAMNQKISTRNTSGKRGVHRKRKGLYQSTLNVNGKCVHAVYHKTFDEACAARDIAEKKYFKAFRPINKETVNNEQHK